MSNSETKNSFNYEPVPDAELNRLWERQQKKFEIAKRLVSEPPEKIFGSQLWNRIFAYKPTALVCIDDRYSLHDVRVPEYAVAGAGVLQKDDHFDFLVDKCNELGVTSVGWHAGCGACEYYRTTKQLNKSTNKIAKEVADQLYGKLNNARMVRGLGLRHADISDDNQRKHHKFHPARGIVFDLSGKVNLGLMEKDHFPSSFQHSQVLHPNIDYSLFELELALGIALGNHGFGKEKFKDDDRLLLFIIGNPNDKEEKAKAYKEKFGTIIKKYKDHILVAAHDAPEFVNKAQKK